MILVLMGVSGSGKTTVGLVLARELGWPYFDADDYHPAANVEKMRAGTPLDDTDRRPWLDRLNELLREHQARGQSVILGCSALKQVYRDRLASGLDRLHWVHLQGSFELIQSRLQARKGHYMPATLLQSQFATLEAPTDALTLDIDATPEVLARRVVDALGLVR
jgi:carbohydrate kinase (thermoresistant glucokinase family)